MLSLAVEASARQPGGVRPSAWCVPMALLPKRGPTCATMRATTTLPAPISPESARTTRSSLPFSPVSILNPQGSSTESCSPTEIHPAEFAQEFQCDGRLRPHDFLSSPSHSVTPPAATSRSFPWHPRMRQAISVPRLPPMNWNATTSQRMRRPTPIWKQTRVDWEGVAFSLRFSELVHLLESSGFRLLREKGSIRYYRKPGHDKLVRIDFHGSREVPTGTCHAILKAAGIKLRRNDD